MKERLTIIRGVALRMILVWGKLNPIRIKGVN